jgi:aldehyde:ferredoxin oxidoreductase
MVSGYANKLLFIDLTREKVSKKRLPKSLIRKYIGGKGFGAKLLYDMLNPHTDPLSPSNILMFFTGPMTATGAPATARDVVVTRSPKTGTFLDSNSGGFWGSWLKISGYDGLIISGRASSLSYIYIHDGDVEIRKADHLKGVGVYKTTEVLVEEVGDKNAKVAAVGPAGENLVKISGIVNDLHHVHARGGPGAVMGSKRLKAIVISADPGNPRFEIAHMDDFDSFNKEFIKEVVFGPPEEWARTDGTPIIVRWSNNVGVLPTRNFQSGVCEFVDNIDAEVMRSYRTSKAACFRCSIACRNLTRIRDDIWGEIDLDGPEYETIALGAANTGLSDFKALIAWNSLADDLGIDTISAGNIIAMAMEAYEKGYISKSDLGGLELRFGNAEAQLELTKLIAFRRGIGDILAEGVRDFAIWLGGDAYKFALETKGLEYPGYDPRGSIGMALAYATADRGACHLRAWPIAEEAFGDRDPYTTEGKAELVVSMQDTNAIKWSMVYCDFLDIDLENMARYLYLVTDMSLKPDELMLIGERINNLIRLFNCREGFTRKDDYIPYRVAYEAMDVGPNKGVRVTPDKFKKMLDEYYSIRGWDKNGVPRKGKLRALGLSSESKKGGLVGVSV